MRRFRLAGLIALTALTTGCKEDLTAPGAGACPEFCPPEQLALVDTVLMDAVVNDSTYSGYVLPHEAGSLQLVDDPGGAVPSSRAILRFLPFGERLLLGAGDTTTGPVVGLDSFDIRLSIQARGDSGLELAFYRVPAGIDSSATFAGLDNYFADSTRIGTVTLPDSLITGVVNARFAADAFPTLDADGRVAAVGVELRAADRGFVTVGSVEANDPPIFTRFVRMDSAGVIIPRLDGKLPSLDTYVAPDPPAPAADLLRIGGSPSGRALLRFTMPARILDSATIVRATLILVPAQASTGAPADTLRMLAQAVAADVGAKSPLVPIAQEQLLTRLVPLIVGRADTVRFDITDLVLRWAADPARARAVMVRAVPEGNTFAEVLFGSTGSAGSRPALQVTFVPPLDLGGR
jgi:hypothetical protein